MFDNDTVTSKLRTHLRKLTFKHAYQVQEKPLVAEVR